MNSYISIFKSKMNDKFVFFVIIITVLMSFIGLGGFVYYIDPFQFFHKSFFSSGFSINQRYQTAGLIKNYPAKNYIFGTSMTENFIASEVQETLKTSDMQRLSISGVLPKNFATVLRFLLSTNKVERVILDAHWYFESQNINKENEQYRFPNYLYSSRFVDSLKYVFNHDNIKLSLDILKGKERGFSKNLDRINRWMKPGLFEKFVSADSLVKVKMKLNKNKRVILSQNLVNQGKSFEYPALDNHLINTLKTFPNVKFDVFFPPYSTWFYASDERKKFIDRLIYMRKYLVDHVAGLKNITIHGFDNNYEIVNDLKNYKDYGHYHPRVNDRIIEAIKSGSNILDKKNSESYLIDMIKNINSYQL